MLTLHAPAVKPMSSPNYEIFELIPRDWVFKPEQT